MARTDVEVADRKAGRRMEHGDARGKCKWVCKALADTCSLHLAAWCLESSLRSRLLIRISFFFSSL